MKSLLQNKLLLIMTAVLLLSAIVLGLLFTGNKKAAVDDTSGISSDVSPNITIPSPENKLDMSSETDRSTASDATLKIDVDGNTQSSSQTRNSAVKESAKPVTEKNPSQSSSSGITIGDQTAPKAEYNCNTPNHHCDGPETHAFITNLEIQGCQFCGSHTCPSFYALDQWGHTWYDVTKCPKYDITKDPVRYCQQCGKKTGDGTNGTCVQFVNDCYCPNCGKWVPSRTCHTCE